MLSYWQVLGESMAGISHNAKNSNLPEFGDSVSAGSKALCGLTEAAAQVTITGCRFNTALIWDHLNILIDIKEKSLKHLFGDSTRKTGWVVKGDSNIIVIKYLLC